MFASKSSEVFARKSSDAAAVSGSLGIMVSGERLFRDEKWVRWESRGACGAGRVGRRLGGLWEGLGGMWAEWGF